MRKISDLIESTVRFRLAIVDLLFIVQIIRLNVTFSLVNRHAFNYAKISKPLAK